MNGILKRERIRSTILNIILVILGFLLCFLKGSALSVLETIMSTAIIIYGFLCLLSFCLTPFLLRDSSTLLEGLIWIIVGSVLNFLPSLFILGFGLIILFEGIKSLANSFDLKRLGDKRWYIDFCFGLVFLMLGVLVVILCNTSVASNIVSIILGISLLLYSISNLVLIYAIHRDFKSVKKFVKETDDGFTDYTIK